MMYHKRFEKGHSHNALDIKINNFKLLSQSNNPRGLRIADATIINLNSLVSTLNVIA